jgi:hypothetical protein
MLPGHFLAAKAARMLTLGTLSAATIAFLLPRPPNEAALYVY